jgi:isopenicillin N synthase-like dioxygenase
VIECFKDSFFFLLQILTNEIYNILEHNFIVNHKKERISILVFCNPNGEKEAWPLKELIHDSNPHRYVNMTFNEYRMFIRINRTRGKSYVQSNIYFR